MLTGRFEKDTMFDGSDFRSAIPRFSPENMVHNVALVEYVKQLAIAKNATPARIALGFLADGFVPEKFFLHEFVRMDFSHHFSRVYPSVKFFGGDISRFHGCFFQRFIFRVGFLGDFRCFIISDLGVKRGDQH